MAENSEGDVRGQKHSRPGIASFFSDLRFAKSCGLQNRKPITPEKNCVSCVSGIRSIVAPAFAHPKPPDKMSLRPGLIVPIKTSDFPSCSDRRIA
jgi:hypothetical protein